MDNGQDNGKATGGSQPRIKEGTLHHAWRGKNVEAFSISVILKEMHIERRVICSVNKESLRNGYCCSDLHRERDSCI